MDHLGSYLKENCDCATNLVEISFWFQWENYQMPHLLLFISEFEVLLTFS